MRFTIDVVFASRDGQVLKLCPNVRPWRVAMAIRGFAALEFAAGAIDRAGLRPGDRLLLEKFHISASRNPNDTSL
jgi:hypothetical protein